MSFLISVGWLRRSCGSTGHRRGTYIGPWVPHGPTFSITPMCLLYGRSSFPLLCAQVVDLAVEAISPEGITLRSQGREAAYLPVAHLSDYTELCEPLLLQHQSRLEAAVARGEQYTLKGLLVVCHKLPIRHAVRHILWKGSIGGVKCELICNST